MMFIEVSGCKYISEVDYLKVVEEKEKLQENNRKWEEISKNTNLNFGKELKEKDEEVKELEERDEEIKELKERNEEIERLKNLLKFDSGKSMYISEGYHKKVVKEKDEKIKELKGIIDVAKNINTVNNYWGKEIKRDLKEKDEEIKLKQNDLKTLSKICNEQRLEIKELKKEKQILKDKLDEWEYIEETWTLKYIYEVDGVTKDYEQNGMIKEDAEELIGMDSDNWNHWSLTKEERPDKDKIIEGLIIRAESGEEVIEELNKTIMKLEKELEESYENR